MRYSALPLLGLVVACQSLPSPDAAKSEVSAAGQSWANAFNSCSATSAAALYMPEAVLWGTVAPAIISGRQGIQGYFERVCSSATPPKVSFGEQLIRVYGDTAINSGAYTFTAVVQGQPRPFAARYSFTYRKVDGQWLIADHHSSARPSPPAPAASSPS